MSERSRGFGFANRLPVVSRARVGAAKNFPTRHPNRPPYEITSAHVSAWQTLINRRAGTTLCSLKGWNEFVPFVQHLFENVPKKL
jgi:hypothetical protein